MNKCKQCGKEIAQIEGKKLKQYCSDRCRIAFKRANPNKSEQTEIKSEQIIPGSEQDRQTGTPKEIAKKIMKWRELTLNGEIDENDQRYQPFAPAWCEKLLSE